MREVDLSIDAGEIVALIGANGAGKSSFLKAIVGQVDRIEGVIKYRGQVSPACRRRRSVRPHRALCRKVDACFLL